METNITVYKTDVQWEFAVSLRKLKQGLDSNLEGRVGKGGMFKWKGTWLIHADIWLKPVQYCKAMILLLKINKNTHQQFPINISAKRNS